MVKGISRQVIVVHSPDQKLFEQAIFILKDGQEGVTDEALMKEAKRLIGRPESLRSRPSRLPAAVWACVGALATAGIWLLTAMF